MFGARLLSQAYVVHVIHSSRRTSPRTMLSAVGGRPMIAMTRVRAMMNTRSKKISVMVARCRTLVFTGRDRKMFLTRDTVELSGTR
nr:hypothetical protein [Rugosimonospora africana]